MWPRVAVVGALAVLLFALSHASLTLPAFTVVGLLAWAVGSSVAAVVLWRRARGAVPPVPLHDRGAGFITTKENPCIAIPGTTSSACSASSAASPS
jgi:hypothetical protein